MFGIKNLLFRGSTANSQLPDELRSAVTAWQALPQPNLQEAHFHVRYVVVDVTTSGPKADSDQLLGLSAVGIQRGGTVCPEDAIALDFSLRDGQDSTVDPQLMAFLQFIGKSPLVGYHVPFLQSFLNRALNERLGVDFSPPTVDLAWMLPSLFEEKSPKPAPLDQWLEWFGIESEGRRAAMVNTLVLARLFQRVLVRAVSKGIVTPGQLLEESSASTFLRRAH